MSATICAFILTFSTLCGSRVVSGVLNPPRNVRHTSFNMDLVLLWDPPEEAPEGLVYTVQYKTIKTTYTEVCTNVSTPKCDFKSHVYAYGKYTSQVRAQAGDEISPWVETNQTFLDKITVIGSPNVSLFSSGATIEVSITDPVFATSSLRSVYVRATYNITYWKEGEEEKTIISNLEQNRVVLNDLVPWTKYCVQVQIDTNRDPKFSEPSTAICESTTDDEEPPWVAAVVTFVAMAMTVSLVVVAVVYRKMIYNFLCPKDTLPQHFKEYLLEPPNSPMYLAMRNSHPPEEVYHQVSIIPDGKTVEEGRPLEAAGTNCSRQQPVTSGC
ncbi:interleukin-10 receptor subunit beta-like [Scomber scombrus]|uniref:interleukin-10 receptor subunit beta-like n=1 Tax=Scomber scombrus TaxID=13677 RepID=UPI002DD96F2F|nr:interleukin-10 receptor subunit beta-like [Scomber scombrus]